MIRPERAADEDAIRAVETAAFGRDEEARIVDDLRASDAFIPELSLVAEDGGAIIGHVMVSRGRVRLAGVQRERERAGEAEDAPAPPITAKTRHGPRHFDHLTGVPPA